jgi:hypothetical protein
VEAAALAGLASAALLVPSRGSIGEFYDNSQMESLWARMHAELLNRRR